MKVRVRHQASLPGPVRRMMGRVVLPMEEMAARASASDLDDPLAHVRACALNVLYLDQLRAAPHKRAPGSGAVRKAVLGTVQSD